MWAIVGMRNSWRPQHQGAILSGVFLREPHNGLKVKSQEKSLRAQAGKGSLPIYTYYQSILQNKHTLSEGETFSPGRKRKAQKHSQSILQSMNNSQLNDQNLIIRTWIAPTPPYFATPRTGHQNKHMCTSAEGTAEFLRILREIHTTREKK